MAGLVAIKITQGCRIKVTPINRLKPGANQVILDLSGGGAHCPKLPWIRSCIPTYLTARQSLLSVASQDFRSGKLLAQPHLGRINFERFSNGHAGESATIPCARPIARRCLSRLTRVSRSRTAQYTQYVACELFTGFAVCLPDIISL